MHRESSPIAQFAVRQGLIMRALCVIWRSATAVPLPLRGSGHERSSISAARKDPSPLANAFRACHDSRDRLKVNAKLLQNLQDSQSSTLQVGSQLSQQHVQRVEPEVWRLPLVMVPACAWWWCWCTPAAQLRPRRGFCGSGHHPSFLKSEPCHRAHSQLQHRSTESESEGTSLATVPRAPASPLAHTPDPGSVF